MGLYAVLTLLSVSCALSVVTVLGQVPGDSCRHHDYYACDAEEEPNPQKEAYTQRRQGLRELGHALLYDEPLKSRPKTNCDLRTLWVRFAGCYIRHSSTTPMGRWRKDGKDWDLVAEEFAMKSWCKHKVFNSCWDIFEGACPHNAGLFQFIPQYLQYTCQVYDHGTRNKWDMCSFSNIQTTFLTKLRKRYLSRQTNTTCPTLSSMGPLILEETILPTLNSSLSEIPKTNLLNARFLDCMTDMIEVWRDMEPVFRDLKCGDDITDIDTFSYRIEPDLGILVSVLRRNKHAFNDVLIPMVKKFKGKPKGSVDSKKVHEKDHLQPKKKEAVSTFNHLDKMEF